MTWRGAAVEGELIALDIARELSGSSEFAGHDPALLFYYYSLNLFSTTFHVLPLSFHIITASNKNISYSTLQFIPILCPRLGAEWIGLMAAQGAFGTDFYDRCTRTIVGTMLWTETCHKNRSERRPGQPLDPANSLNLKPRTEYTNASYQNSLLTADFTPSLLTRKHKTERNCQSVL